MRGLAVMLAAAALALPSVAHAQDGPECLQLVPQTFAMPAGERIELRVLVLLDGVPEATARELVQHARTSYAPLGLDLVPAGFIPVNLAEREAIRMLAELRGLFGGARPEWTHLVFAATAKDVYVDGWGETINGQAACIGGVAYPEHAFALAEVRPVDYDPLQPAKLMAHELGHLMGAHHHYANCVEAAAMDPGFPCTLMHTDTGFANFPFSTVNAAIVRGHAEDHVKPLPPVPSPAAGPPHPPAGSAPAARPAATACVDARRRLLRAARSEVRARRALRRRPSSAARARLRARVHERRRAEQRAARACR